MSSATDVDVSDGDTALVAATVTNRDGKRRAARNRNFMVLQRYSCKIEFRMKDKFKMNIISRRNASLEQGMSKKYSQDDSE